MNKEIVYIKCANIMCDRDIPFIKGSYSLPVKTYCDYCCGEMTTPPDNTPIDSRALPRLYKSNRR